METERSDAPDEAPVDPEEWLWETPGVEGIPFGKNSEEAQAIERIIRRSKRKRAQAGRSPSEP